MFMVVIVINIVFLFILSHIIVDKEFDNNMKVGAYIVIGLISLAYLIFGVLT